MSIIGTRPPLISETNFYELHHIQVRRCMFLAVCQVFFIKKYKLGIKVVTEMLRFPQPSKVKEKGKNP